MAINFDEKNYRKHNETNKELINKSLKECGAGRSIVIDSEDNIIAGNGIYEQAQKLNIPTKIIETNGDELVVVKRIDLKTNDEKRKQLAIMDNSTSDSSDFDYELLGEYYDNETLTNWGVDIPFNEEDVDDDIEEINEINTKCNIIIECSDMLIAKELDKKFNLNINFDNQRFTCKPESFLNYEDSNSRV